MRSFNGFTFNGFVTVLPWARGTMLSKPNCCWCLTARSLLFGRDICSLPVSCHVADVCLSPLGFLFFLQSFWERSMLTFMLHINEMEMSTIVEQQQRRQHLHSITIRKMFFERYEYP